MTDTQKPLTPQIITLHNDYQRCFTRNGKPIQTIEINGGGAAMTDTQKPESMSAEEFFTKYLEAQSNETGEYLIHTIGLLAFDFAEAYATQENAQLQAEIIRLKQELADEYSADREIQAICAKQQDDLDRANVEVKRLKEALERASQFLEHAPHKFNVRGAVMEDNPRDCILCIVEAALQPSSEKDSLSTKQITK